MHGSPVDSFLISRADAFALVFENGGDVDALIAWFGDCAEYDEVDLMAWLGF